MTSSGDDFEKFDGREKFGVYTGTRARDRILRNSAPQIALDAYRSRRIIARGIPRETRQNAGHQKNPRHILSTLLVLLDIRLSNTVL